MFWLRGLLHHVVASLKRRGRNHTPYRICAFPNDLIGREIAVGGTYEGAGIAAVEWMCERGVIDIPQASAFLDIGANVDVYTVALATRFAGVLAFEPHPVTHQVLTLNVHINDLRNVSLFDYGLSDSDMKTQLWEGNADNVGASSVERGAGTGAHYTVMLRHAATAVSGATDLPVTFIKMDVEGHEPKVIAGLRSLLVKQLPVIAFEANDPIHNQTLLTQLQGLGYATFLALDYRPALPYLWLRVVALSLVGVRTRLKVVSLLEGKKYSLVFALSQRAAARWDTVQKTRIRST